MRVQPGDVLFRIADHSVVWVLVDVPSATWRSVAVGQPATVRARSYPGPRCSPGRSTLVYPHLNKETRTARVRIELPNPDGVLLPGHVCRCRDRHRRRRSRSLAVPDSAVIDSGTGRSSSSTRARAGSSRATSSSAAGATASSRSARASPKASGSSSSANFLIDAESNLKAALQGLRRGGRPAQ